MRSDSLTLFSLSILTLQYINSAALNCWKSIYNIKHVAQLHCLHYLTFHVYYFLTNNIDCLNYIHYFRWIISAQSACVLDRQIYRQTDRQIDRQIELQWDLGLTYNDTV